MNLARHDRRAMLRMRIIPNIAIHRRPRHDILMHLAPQVPTVPEVMGPGHVVRVVARAHLVHGGLLRALPVLVEGRVDLGVEFLDQFVVVTFREEPGEGYGVEDAAVAAGFDGGFAAGSA